jgi:hypothetical protein
MDNASKYTIRPECKKDINICVIGLRFPFSSKFFFVPLRLTNWHKPANLIPELDSRKKEYKAMKNT